MSGFVPDERYDIGRLAPLAALSSALNEPTTLTPDDWDFILAPSTNASDIATRFRVYERLHGTEKT